MSDHKARVRKLVTRFSSLSDDGKDTILEQMEALKQGERIIPGTQGAAVNVLTLMMGIEKQAEPVFGMY